MAIMITFTTKHKGVGDQLNSWVKEQDILEIDDIKLVSCLERDSIVRIIPYRVRDLYEGMDDELRASFEAYMNNELGEE